MDEDNSVRSAEDKASEEEYEDDDEGGPGKILLVIGVGGSIDSCIIGFSGEATEDVLGVDTIYLPDHINDLPEVVGIYVWEGILYPGSYEPWEGVWRRATRDDIEEMAPELVNPLYVSRRKLVV